MKLLKLLARAAVGAAVAVALAAPAHAQTTSTIPYGVIPCRVTANATVTVCGTGAYDVVGYANTATTAQTATFTCADQNGGVAITGTVIQSVGALAAGGAAGSTWVAPVPHRAAKGVVCQLSSTVVSTGVDVYLRPVGNSGGYPGSPS